MSKQKSLSVRILWTTIAIAVLVVAFFLPTPEGLSDGGKMGLALLISGIVLWVAEPMPMAVSAFGLMVMMPFLGVVDAANMVWSGFISSVIFFILASFGITAALLKTKIPAKITFTLLKVSKGSSRLIVLSFMLVTAFVSMFISDLPCTALFAGFAMSNILEIEKAVNQSAAPGENYKLGKGLMIGIAWASILGGFCTPIGSSLNIMAMGMLTAATEITIPFFSWVLIAFPMAAILLIISWVCLMVFYKPETLSESTIQQIKTNATGVGRMDVIDKKVIAIIVLLFIAWITNSWTGWDATVIAVLGLVVLFLPGIDVLNWKEYMASISWGIVLLIGGVQSLAGGIQQQGAASWLLGSTVGKFAISAAAIIGAAAVFVPIIRLAIPVGPALIAICLMPLLSFADTVGVSAVVFTVIVALNGQMTYLLGIDNNHMLTYRHGYWTLGDFFKVGIIPTLVMMALCAFLVSPLVSLVGL